MSDDGSNLTTDGAFAIRQYLEGALLEGVTDTAERSRILAEINDLLDELTTISSAELTAEDAFANLTGFSGGAPSLDNTDITVPVARGFDETVAEERILAVADLYFLYMHERIGVFEVIHELRRQFEAGKLRLSSGDGAQRLYRYDRRQVLQYNELERHQAYRRVFGYYRNVAPPTGADPFDEFHSMFRGFCQRVAAWDRDRTVASVIKQGGDPLGGGYGSVAAVRRSGLDLRNRLKAASYGHVNVLRREVKTLLRSAFDILEAEDIRKLYGASDSWDVIDAVSRQYLNREPLSSQRNKMAITGQSVLTWLASSKIQGSGDKLAQALGDTLPQDCQEWLTSEAALKASVAAKRSSGTSGSRSSAKVLPMRRRAV